MLRTMLLLILLSCSISAQVVDSDETLRGVFLKSRAKSVVPAKAKAGLRKTTEKPATTDREAQKVQVPPDAPMILGYTLFKKGRNGKPLAVDATTIFKEGDALRFAVEANCEGFLYIFTQENTGDVRMLFPSPRLMRGANYLLAHHRLEIPSRQEPDPDNQWFLVDQQPAQEHFYFVLSREPIPGVPFASALLKYDQSAGGQEWKPPHPLWEGVLGKTALPMVTQQNAAAPEIKPEERRGIGLRPKPGSGPRVLTRQSREGFLLLQVTLTHQ